jgi:magnesium-protoporphyrin O-methyltransferase
MPSLTEPGPDPAASPEPRPPDCCAVDADPRIGRWFDRLTAERTAGGVLPPMVAVSEHLLAQLGDVSEARPTVLELGCGSGALLVELLTRGVSWADGIDLSPASLDAARRRADAAGVGERVQFAAGDAARLELAPHDWVILDRAICCYPDMPALINRAIGAARARVCFSVPTSRGARGRVNRLAWGLEAWWTRVRRGPCPGYVHDLDDLERRLSAAGFQRRSGRTDFLWYTAVWERPAHERPT